MTDVVPGLREQKRAATRRALRLGLLRLALDRGFANVTVEEVAQSAGVSARTFFNYFATKEQALVEPHGETAVSAAERAEYLAGDGDPVSDLVRIIAARSTTDDDLEIHRLRRELMDREPGLLGEKAAVVRRLHAEFSELAIERLRFDAERDGSSLGEREAGERATLVVMMAVAVGRLGWSRWAAADGTATLEDSLLTSLDDLVAVAADVLRANRA